MGRLDLLDVYRDEEPHVCMCVVTDDDWTHWRPCPPSLCERVPCLSRHERTVDGGAVRGVIRCAEDNRG